MPDHNAPGGKITTREATIAAYDKLPPVARLALQNAVFDYDAIGIARAWTSGKRGFRSGDQIARRIAMSDQHQIARDCVRVWGMDRR